MAMYDTLRNHRTPCWVVHLNHICSTEGDPRTRPTRRPVGGGLVVVRNRPGTLTLTSTGSDRGRVEDKDDSPRNPPWYGSDICRPLLTTGVRRHRDAEETYAITTEVGGRPFSVQQGGLLGPVRDVP